CRPQSHVSLFLMFHHKAGRFPTEGGSMVTAVVRFRLPEWTTREDAKAMFEKSAPNYRGVPGLVRKYYLYGDDRTGGGVYLWNSREAAERFYSEAWRSVAIGATAVGVEAANAQYAPAPPAYTLLLPTALLQAILRLHAIPAARRAMAMATAPGPYPDAVIVNPVTGRWCRTESNGYQFCWTP